MSLFLLDLGKPCLFVHIPKTGGTSIRKDRQIAGPTMYEPDPTWPKDLPSFAFVRDPKERIESCWRDFHYLRPLTVQMGKKDATFTGFLEGLEKRITNERAVATPRTIAHHVSPMLHPVHGLVHAQKVGRYETLQEDFNAFCWEFDLKAFKLPRHRSTRHCPRVVWTSQDHTLVEKIYADDLNYVEDLATVATETSKYQRVWAMPEYREGSNGLKIWQQARGAFPTYFKSALDIGCGAGRLFDEWNQRGIDAWAIDIAKNSLDQRARRRWGHKFIQGSIWEMEWDRRFDFGICIDVMEHIPPKYVEESLCRIAACCDEVLFRIARAPARTWIPGLPLHLTTEPLAWWIERMREISGSVERVPYDRRYVARWRP